jgi:hypothetical protein
MQEIAEKPDLMNTRTVKVCTKAGISSHPKPKNPCFCVHFQKYGRWKGFS